MCYARVTMYPAQSILLGLTWGRGDLLLGLTLMSKEYDLVGAMCLAEGIITNSYVMINQRPYFQANGLLISKRNILRKLLGNGSWSPLTHFIWLNLFVDDAQLAYGPWQEVKNFFINSYCFFFFSFLFF